MTTAAPANGDLKVEVENTRTWGRRLTITVPSDRVENERHAVTRRIANQIRLPGFRKGKVPTGVLEKKYGPAIEQETIEKIVQDSYREAIQREGFQPISQGAIDKLEYQRGQDLTFNVEFEIRPEIELNRLGGFSVHRPGAEVTDDQISRVIDRLRRENAPWESLADRSPVNGDMVDVEITPLDSHEAAAPQQRRYQVVLGEGQTVPTVEEAIRSLKPGEEGDFVLEVHQEEGGMEHEHRAHIKVLDARTPNLPPLDDDFARSLGEFADVDALRAAVAADLAREMHTESERSIRGQLLQQVIDANTFEVPDAMVDNYIQQVVRPRKGVSEEQVQQTRVAARPMAEQTIRRMLVIEKVADLESLHATPSEVDSRIEEVAQRMGRPTGQVRSQLEKNGQLAQIEEEITEDKVFAYLKSLSNIE